ncbi:MAG: OmpA family protein [Bacteroidota bacterium]|nr:OmpA family protein [Bacteroidota bacterium]
MKTKLFTTTLLLLIFLQAYGEKLPKEIKADAYYNTFSFQKAIDKYTQIESLDTEGQRRLADCYRKVHNYQKAEEMYAKIVQSPGVTKEDLFNYILALRQNGKYTEANKQMDEFARSYPGDQRSISYKVSKKDFEKMLTDQGCFTVRNLNFNGPQVDFGPAYFNGNIVFASSRSNNRLTKRLYNWDDKPYLNLFVAKVDSGQFVQLKSFSKKLNKKWHEGPASFSNKGRFMAFTRDNYNNKSKDGSVNLQLYFSVFGGEKWSDPISFKLNSPEYSIGHPSLTEDGKTLYFASDMPGGFGGVDLYRIQRLPSGEWGEPENLGKGINTEGDEMFPFYHESDQTLFFSSNGHAGLGGLDIFTTCFEKGKWSKVKNLGVPVNGKDDDFALIVDPQLKSGYFSSNRQEGKGDDDIYSFAVLKPFNEKFKAESLRLYVLNKQNGHPIQNATIIFCDNTHLTSAENGLVSRGVPEMESCAIKAEAFGYSTSGKNLDLRNEEEKAVLTDTLWLELDRKFVLHNINYDFDKWDILPESAVELDKLVALMNANQEIKVELGSHTDSRGSAEYNHKLSQLRAESVKKYLVSKGIDEKRIKAIGYGESQLLNRCADGVDCTPEEHRENRRTEVFIPGLGKGENIKQQKGDYSDGTQNHKKEYSSKKAHGSIFDKKVK